MIYISDLIDHRGDFGSSGTVKFFYDVAVEKKLEYLEQFLNDGFSTEADTVAEEIDSIEWPSIDGYDEVADYVSTALNKCKDNTALLVN
jgi:hypothetical protein